MDEARSLRRAAWAGAASVALLAVGLALTYLVGVDQASMSDAAILARLDDGGRQAAAGIGVGILTVPLVASISEDAMRSVPLALREASAGMGARKITTTVSVVIPAAVSGLVAAFIVAVSRAIGETMVVAIAAGATGGSQFTLDVLKPGQTMTAAMAAQAAGTDSVRGAALTFQSLFFVGSLLFAITLSLNLVADRFVRRVRQRY